MRSDVSTKNHTQDKVFEGEPSPTRSPTGKLSSGITMKSETERMHHIRESLTGESGSKPFVPPSVAVRPAVRHVSKPSQKQVAKVKRHESSALQRIGGLIQNTLSNISPVVIIGGAVLAVGGTLLLFLPYAECPAHHYFMPSTMFSYVFLLFHLCVHSAATKFQYDNWDEM